MGSKEIIPVNKITERMLPPHLRNKSRGRSISSSSLNPSENDYLVAAESILTGNAIHLASDGLAYKANATDSKPALAFALNDAVTGETVYLATSRRVTVASASFTIGAEIFLSSGTNNITTIIPTLSNGLIVQRLGRLFLPIQYRMRL
jgi:hypothetical protein